MSVTLHRSFPVANKLHRCGSCGGPIAAAEQYHRWKGTTDVTEGVVTLKECRDCFERFERYVYERVHLSSENLAQAEAWLGRSLPHAFREVQAGSKDVQTLGVDEQDAERAPAEGQRPSPTPERSSGENGSSVQHDPPASREDLAGRDSSSPLDTGRDSV